MLTHNAFKKIFFTSQEGIKLLLILVLIPLVFFFSPQKVYPEQQDVVDTKENQEIFLYLGDLVTLKVYSLTRISISKEGVVDIVNADVDEILLIGRAVGETPIFIWDEHGKRTVFVRVFEDDLELITARIERLLQFADIQGVVLETNHYENKVMATGKITRYRKTAFDEILKEFGDLVIDMVTESEELIHIDVQISELSTTLTKELGFDWTAGTGTSLSVAFTETLPSTSGKIEDLFKLGDFNRTSALLATVKALIQDGKARILSQPSVVVSNGEDATFLVGGEIPIRTTTTSTGGSSIQENVTFKPYGIDLNVTPEIKDGKIDVTLSVSIRDIDAANAVGDDVAFTTRTAETKLFLNDGQTTIIAGLIKQNESETVTRVPFLSKLPIVGVFFRKTTTPAANQEQEIVISLTMRIIKDEGIGEIAKREPFLDYDFQEEEALFLDDEDDIVESWEWEEEVDEDLKEDIDAEEQRHPDPDLSGEGYQKEILIPTSREDDGRLAVEETAVEEIAVEKTAKEEADIFDELAEDTNDLQFLYDEWDVLPSEDEQEDIVAAEQAPPLAGLAGLPRQRRGLPEDFYDSAIEEMDFDDILPEEAIVTAYAQVIQQKIAQAISFPYEAQRQGWEGEVTLSLVVLSDGSLNDVVVRKSSGYDVFDKDAINTTQILAPFDPFPVELNLEEIVLTVPIVYSQESVLGIGG